MVTETQLFEYPGLTPLDFCFWGWIKCDVYKRRVDTRDELFARILDAAARIKKREDQLRRTARDLRTQIAKGTEADGGIFKHFKHLL
jgi:hypothetical protein